MTDESESVVVVGGGLAGALMATLLCQAGRSVTLLERRLDPRRAGAERGRSINLAISTRGLHALAAVGLEAEIQRIATPLRGRMIHSPQGELAFQPYGTLGQAINSVSRADLNLALINAAERTGRVSLHFGKRCADVDLQTGKVITVDVTTNVTEEFAGDIVIGADGAFSVIRGQLQRRDRYDFSQTYLQHGYKELIIPPAPDGGFRLEKNALHIWPRGGYMMMAMANVDGSFTVTLYLSHEGPNSFAHLSSSADVQRFFQSTFPDAVALLPTLTTDFFAHPTGSLLTVRSWPWHAGRIVLVGDACHAVVPFYGQGANAAFEDCLALAECLGQEGDASKAFATYAARRKPNVDALADLALTNFVEMRDHVASPAFRAKKRLERILHSLFPKWFVPLYPMISFSRIPYAEAAARAQRQDRVVHRVGWVLLAMFAAALLWSGYRIISS